MLEHILVLRLLLIEWNFLDFGDFATLWQMVYLIIYMVPWLVLLFVSLQEGDLTLIELSLWLVELKYLLFLYLLTLAVFALSICELIKLYWHICSVVIKVILYPEPVVRLLHMLNAFDTLMLADLLVHSRLSNLGLYWVLSIQLDQWLVVRLHLLLIVYDLLEISQTQEDSLVLPSRFDLIKNLPWNMTVVHLFSTIHLLNISLPWLPLLPMFMDNLWLQRELMCWHIDLLDLGLWDVMLLHLHVMCLLPQTVSTGLVILQVIQPLHLWMWLVVASLRGEVILLELLLAFTN